MSQPIISPGKIQQLSTELPSLESGLAIVVDGDKAPRAISKGQYLFIKNHSTLATGGYHATAAISSGANVAESVSADSDGICNSGLIKPTLITSHSTFKSPDDTMTWKYVGCSITLPAYSFGCIEARTSWSSGRPEGLLISTSNTSIEYTMSWEIPPQTSTSIYSLTCNVFTGSTTKTYYLWERRASSGTYQNVFDMSLLYWKYQ